MVSSPLYNMNLELRHHEFSILETPAHLVTFISRLMHSIIQNVDVKIYVV